MHADADLLPSETVKFSEVKSGRDAVILENRLMNKSVLLLARQDCGLQPVVNQLKFGGQRRVFIP